MLRLRELVSATCTSLLGVSACTGTHPPTKTQNTNPPPPGVAASLGSVRSSPTSGPAPQLRDRADASNVVSSINESAPDAGQPVPLPEWSAQPTGSTVLVFRDVYVGMLPARGRRTTWSLITSGVSVLLRVEEQIASRPMPHLDRTSIQPDSWSAPTRTEYAGTATAQSPPFAFKLRRNFGVREPKELALNCAAKTIQVHPAFATLVEGWTNSDDSMEPAAWAPARTERIQALNCKPTGETPSFSDGLSFVRGRPATAKDLEMSGVEWGFVNSDMVIQEGGYRWIPSFSLRHAR
jgi:hypothetical protein